MSVPIVSIFSTVDYEAQIHRAADILRSGKLIVLPTETVYGAAGLLSHPDARERLRTLRDGADDPKKPFTIHVARAGDAAAYLGSVSDLGQRMMKKLWPGPVGLVFDVPAARRAEVAAQLNVAERDIYDPSGSITLRCPDDIVAIDTIEAAAGPVVLTLASSAGAAGGSSTVSPAGEIAQELEGKVELVFDTGPTRYAQPSTIVRVGAESYQIVRKGVFDERIIERLLRTTILFVCSGNTCRSPMAEAITRHLLAEDQGIPPPDLEKKGINVLSAGAFAMPGSRATPAAVDAVRTLGADLTSHRSRQLTPELIHQADVIFTMGRSHAHAVASLVPSARERVATLDPAGDIEDPIGGDASLYQDLAGQLRTLIERRLKEKALLTVH